jgi:hypothetical protein
MSIESYGMMCSYNDAIAWAERQPDSTVKDCAIRRMRYERDKTTPVRPKYHKGHYGKKYDTWSCGNCGAGLPEAHWRFCPQCGFAIAKREVTE